MEIIESKEELGDLKVKKVSARKQIKEQKANHSKDFKCFKRKNLKLIKLRRGSVVKLKPLASRSKTLKTSASASSVSVSYMSLCISCRSSLNFNYTSPSMSINRIILSFLFERTFNFCLLI